MTTDDKQFLKQFLSGAKLGVGVMGVVVLLTIILNGAANWLDAQPTPQQPKSNFTVIDTYKGCDVVQWHYSMLADYKYFLDCSK